MKLNAHTIFWIAVLGIAAVLAYWVGDFYWLLGAGIGAILGLVVGVYRRYQKTDRVL